MHTSAYVSIRQHTRVSIRQHTSAYVTCGRSGGVVRRVEAIRCESAGPVQTERRSSVKPPQVAPQVSVFVLLH
jgi:hypothetical protein